MKIILKNTRWFTMITTLCFVAVALFAANGCDKPETSPKTCNVDNPLTDLAWLKAKVDEIGISIQNGNPLSVSIYQCVYDNGKTGFLIDEGNTKPFYNCNGEVLCIMGGYIGETCPKLNIVNKKLIWEKNYSAEIPRMECAHEGGYMDTINMEGIGYLFVNSIPVELQKDNDVMYIIYNKEDDSATFSAAYPTDALYNGNICNFPDFAKGWEIPVEGKQIYYKGELYVTGIYLSAPPHIGGDLILTTLK